MILYLDTSGKTAKVWLDENYAEFALDRNMAKELLGKIDAFLEQHHSTWHQLTGLALMKGAGSFTGLRIGASILNAVASSEKIPIVGEKTTANVNDDGGEKWRMAAKKRLLEGHNDKIVVPFYQKEANITQPKR
ncbi:MAG: hypothetical protein LBE03_00210 [Candidatus Nomurabacteria bacterium]|jgi:tRNA threonylcarbamoyladenosine biosynthesis protein TsaB|nr:hypothetical protein [Candidatus Nomurabacteria bacterium]